MLFDRRYLARRACCSRLALNSLPALIIVASILSPKSLYCTACCGDLGMLLKFSSQFIARCNHRGLPFVSEEFVEATDSTAQPAVAIWACCSRLALNSSILQARFGWPLCMANCAAVFPLRSSSVTATTSMCCTSISHTSQWPLSAA